MTADRYINDIKVYQYDHVIEHLTVELSDGAKYDFGAEITAGMDRDHFKFSER